MDCFSVTNILHVSHEETEAPIEFSSTETHSPLQDTSYSHERHSKHFLRAQACIGEESSDF